MVRHDRDMRRLAAELFEVGYGYKIVASRLGLPRQTVRRWQLTYRAVGIEVLLQMGSEHRRYSYETKLAAARSVVEGGSSVPEAMEAYGVASRTVLQGWCRLYRAGGADALKPKPKGRPKGAKAKTSPMTREQELERRIQKLEAENAYLKKSIALKAQKRLETEKRRLS